MESFAHAPVSGHKIVDAGAGGGEVVVSILIVSREPGLLGGGVQD